MNNRTHTSSLKFPSIILCFLFIITFFTCNQLFDRKTALTNPYIIVLGITQDGGYPQRLGRNRAKPGTIHQSAGMSPAWQLSIQRLRNDG